MDKLPFDPSLFTDPNAGRRKINDMLAFDPFFGAAPIDIESTITTLDPYCDDKMGKAWHIDEFEGRDAANRFLLQQGLQPIPEADGK